jgi:DNA ligase-1
MTDKPFKPMLAADFEDSELRYPLLGSLKLDGVRAYMKGGVVYSRTNKPIPNRFIQRTLTKHRDGNGLDGELIVGPPNAKNTMQATMSGVMRVEGEPDFNFYAFDMIDAEPLTPYYERLKHVATRVRAAQTPKGHFIRLPQKDIANLAELDAFEAQALADGYEGVMVRDPVGRYKQGRSTVKEAYLLKIKRFSDGEAEVIGVEEMMHNDNEKVLSETGHSKRSTHAAGLRPAGVLGALVVRDLATGVVFNIGSGFTAEQRKDLWSNPHDDVPEAKVIGLIVKYKSFPIGVKNAPRFGTFIGFRDRIDL